MISRINDIKIGVDVFGDSGPAVVLIHGSALNRTIWHAVAAEGLQGFQVILPDVRGHGESEATDGAYPMSLLADDLAGLLTHLGVAQAFVLGHSMGGYIALAFAEQYPDRIQGIGLITSKAHADSKEKREGRYQMAEEIRKRGSIALAESLAPRISRDPAVIKLAYEMIKNTSDRGAIGVTLGMAERPDRTDDLAKLRIPGLVVAGEDDQIIPVESTKQMAESIPNGQFAVIPQSGHLPMVEAPQTLSDCLQSWLSDQI